MTHDLHGLALSARPEAVPHWNAAVTGVLSHAASTPGHLEAALEADPDFALAHAAKGLFLLLLGRRELDAPAAAALRAARAAAEGRPVTPREALYAEALGAWLGGSPSEAVRHLEAVLAAHPGDALAMKLNHSVRFTLGDAAGMRASLEACAPAYGADHPARGYLDGCRAFALEETGDYAAALAAGHEAVARAPDDAWGLHAVAHVHEMTHDPAAGIAWLAAREGGVAHCNNFRFHVWWHRALMHLDRGEVGTALALYDRRIRSEATDDWRDLSNAASLLARLGADGHAVGNRWEELAAIAERRAGDGAMVFADLHYVLALTGGGRTEAARAMLARIARDAARPCETGRRMAAPGRPVAEGLVAFAEGRHRAAWAALRPAMRDLPRAGGSHAQRDVFARIAVDAGIRAGDLAGAETLLRLRSAQRAHREDAFHAARMDMIAAARQDVAAHAS